MRFIRNVAVAGALAACIACGNSSQDAPPLETQALTPPQPTDMPERVQGCLRAGEAAGTFVLTASATDTALMTAATYQLVDPPDGLLAQVGKRVEVTGTVISEQTAQSRGAMLPADDQPRGTSGAPTVQSTSEVEVKRLRVTGVTPVDGDCEGDE